jgi:hypothetical protein
VIASGPLDDEPAIDGEQWRRKHVKCSGPPFLGFVHRWRDLFGRSDCKDCDLDTARTGGVLKCLEVRRFGDDRVRQDCDTPRAGHGLHEDFLPLAIEFGRENADAGGIAARTGERAHDRQRDCWYSLG